MNVLIVNNYTIGDCNPVGYTMKNMLLGMPDVNWLQYCVDYRAKEHIKLTDCLFNDVNDSLSYRLKARKEKPVPQTETENKGDSKNSSAPVAPAAPALPTARNTNARGEFIRGLFYSLPCGASKANLQKIKEFKPDVIYTMAENIRVINQAIKLSKKLNIPIVYHCMDDYKATAYTASSLTKVFHYYLLARFKRMHKFSVENIGICQIMADYYSATYKTPYSFAGNCVFDYNEEPYTPDRSKPMKLLYSGSLHFHRGEMLQKLAKIIDELNDEGYPIELEIYAPTGHLGDYKDAVNKYAHAKWMQYAYPQTEKMKCFKQADIFVHTESLDPTDMTFVKYSFSTKLPEYFAIGRAVLGFGTKELASIKYIEDNNCGWVCETEEDTKELLKYLYNNPQERVQLAQNAYKLATDVFSQKAMQKKIYDVFDRSRKAKK